MVDQTQDEPVESLTQGTYRPARRTDLRGPCPMVNCLANHGYLHRDGRNIHAGDLYSAMRSVGLMVTLAGIFSHAILLEHKDPKAASGTTPQQTSLGHRIWSLICNPLAYLFSNFGVRKHGQVDDLGKPSVGLNDLGLNGAVEHDVSLTRLDIAQGDNCSPQQDLILDLLAASSDGGHTLTMADLAAYRQKRINAQKSANKDAVYGAREHDLACSEIALILQVLGDGKKVRCDYLKAFLLEERLPVKEGWKRRKWWPVGLVEIKLTANKVKATMGLEF